MPFPPEKRKQQGVGAHCSILLKYLHPQQKIGQVIPINGCEYEQQLHDCVVVSPEIRNIKRKPKVCIVVKHDTFGGNLIWCVLCAKVTVEGEADGYFDQKQTDLPLFTNAPTFSPDDLWKPMDTSLLDIGGSGSRSEDVALA